MKKVEDLEDAYKRAGQKEVAAIKKFHQVKNEITAMGFPVTHEGDRWVVQEKHKKGEATVHEAPLRSSRTSYGSRSSYPRASYPAHSVETTHTATAA